MVISSVKLIKLEVRDRLGIPHAQCVDYVVAVTNDRHIIRDRQNRLVVLLDKFVFSRLRVFLKTDISSETYFLCILFSAELEGVSFLEPVIRNLHLIAVLDLLLEHSIAVADAAAVCRIIQCCEGIQEACGESS